MPRQDVPPGGAAGTESIPRATKPGGRKHSRDSLLLEKLQDYNREVEPSFTGTIDGQPIEARNLEVKNGQSIFLQYTNDGGDTWKDINGPITSQEEGTITFTRKGDDRFNVIIVLATLIAGATIIIGGLFVLKLLVGYML